MKLRLRSASDVPRPSSRLYNANAEFAFDRCLSAPDLTDSALQYHITDLDAESARLLASVYLDQNERYGSHYMDHRRHQTRRDLGRIQQSSPPDYKTLAPIAPRYPILPREEEGRETLPGYTPSVVKDGLVLRKMELSSPFAAAQHRNWSAVHVEINNTQLNIYHAIRKQPRDKSDRKYSIDRLIRSYTLQYADVGVAVDYLKRPFVVRVRAEQEQFLIDCGSQEDCIVWINVLQMAIDLSLPLEERRLPKYRSIPRRSRRRRRQESTTPAEAPPGLEATATTNTRPESTHSGPPVASKIRQISRIFRPRGLSMPLPVSQAFSSVATTTPPPAAAISASSPAVHTLSNDPVLSSTVPMTPVDSVTSMASLCAASTIASSVLSQRDPITPATSNSSHDDSDVEDIEEEDEDESDASRIGIDSAYTGTSSRNSIKWDPGRVPTPYLSFLRYAQRCLATLPMDSPWLDKTIVLEGRKYVVREGAFERISGSVAVR